LDGVASWQKCIDWKFSSSRTEPYVFPRRRAHINNLRKYGEAPFNVAVIHGGPGAPGEMAPVARELASEWGVLEPLQTVASVKGQVKELKNVLEKETELPVTLIGFSWGAWLSFIAAADYPSIVKKLILVGSGSFESKYAAGIHQTRLNRLNEGERKEIETLIEILDNPAPEDTKAAFERLGELCSKTDAFDPITYKTEIIDCRADIFQSVWKEAAEMRRSGRLMELGKNIDCPVVAIHGDYDPHLAEGVQKPLSAVLKDFKFILLENCGHKPWIERQARDKFYNVLREELR
jgi:pimeloyl-ACP methyl ester carboxylesterase